MSGSSRAGHTLIEVMISGTLLMFALGLVTVPFVMAKNGMTLGSQKVESQHDVRAPIDRLMRQLQGAHGVEITPPDPDTRINQISFYHGSTTPRTRYRYCLEPRMTEDGTKQLTIDLPDPLTGIVTTSIPLYWFRQYQEVWDTGLNVYQDAPGSPFTLGKDITWLRFEARAWDATSSDPPILTPGAGDLVSVGIRLVQEKTVRRQGEVLAVGDLVQMALTATVAIRN